MPDAKTSDSTKATCFIAMPVTTQDADADLYNDDQHWKHVMESLFVPAVEMAGFEAIVPVTKGSSLIHADIIKHLENADLVLCDLSSHNPNVFFELGVRTSLDKPVALVRDEHTALPFDTSGINTHEYSSALRGWDLEKERHSLRDHVVSGAETCEGRNPLWRQFGLTIRAQEPDVTQNPLEAKVDYLVTELQGMRRRNEASEALRRELMRDVRAASPSPGSVDELPSPRVAELLETMRVKAPGFPMKVLAFGTDSLVVAVQDLDFMPVATRTTIERHAKKAGVELQLVDPNAAGPSNAEQVQLLRRRLNAIKQKEQLSPEQVDPDE